MARERKYLMDYKSQYTIIYKYRKRTRQLKLKKELKIFPQETMMASENRFAPELNEKEVVEPLENATAGSIKKAIENMVWKYFKVKTWKHYFDNLSIRVSQSKTKQVQTIYTFKNYLYIGHPVSCREDLSDILGAFLIKKIFQSCWIWDDYSQLGATRSHIQRAHVE